MRARGARARNLAERRRHHVERNFAGFGLRLSKVLIDGRVACTFNNSGFHDDDPALSAASLS